NAGHCADMAVGIGDIPDMVGKVALIAGAVVLVLVFGSASVDRLGAIGRTDADAPEACLDRLQNLLAQLLSRTYCHVRVVWNIGDAFYLRDFRVQEVPHKEGWRQLYPAEFFQGLDAGGSFHRLCCLPDVNA